MKKFFRPSPAIVLPSVVLTAVAGGLMYYALLCALDGSGTSCFQVPFVVQAVLIVLLWPWVACVRLMGNESIALASVIGFALSGFWVFILGCIVRWGISLRIKFTSSH